MIKKIWQVLNTDIINKILASTIFSNMQFSNNDEMVGHVDTYACYGDFLLWSYQDTFHELFSNNGNKNRNVMW